jgi:hypothetical protein
MVIPVVAAAAARVAATSAARAAATSAARAGAQATVRAGAQQATTRTATAGARSTVAQGTTAEGAAAKNVGGYVQNTAAERNTIQLGNRPAESRTAGERGGQITQNETVEQAQQLEQDSRTRDRRIRRSSSAGEEGELEEEPKKRGMSVPTLVGMLLVAFIFDGLQTLTALLVFGVVTAAISYIVAFISNILAWVIFIIWFGLCGMNIFGGRKIVVAIIGFVADTALAGIVPYWTVTVLVAYFDEKLEEKGIGLSKVVSMLK